MTDYELYKLLEANGLETTKENLEILKESIDDLIFMSNLLEANGFETTEENLEILAESLDKGTTILLNASNLSLTEDTDPDYVYMQILDKNGFKVTKNNVQVLKEAIDNGHALLLEEDNPEDYKTLKAKFKRGYKKVKGGYEKGKAYVFKHPVKSAIIAMATAGATIAGAKGIADGNENYNDFHGSDTPVAVLAKETADNENTALDSMASNTARELNCDINGEYTPAPLVFDKDIDNKDAAKKKLMKEIKKNNEKKKRFVDNEHYNTVIDNFLNNDKRYIARYDDGKNWPIDDYDTVYNANTTANANTINTLASAVATRGEIAKAERKGEHVSSDLKKKVNDNTDIDFKESEKNETESYPHR